MTSVFDYPPDVLSRLQQVETEILLVIDEVCDKLGIEYVLDGGTCLGAVRHKGPIPWDDDADIGMFVEDYDIFCSKAGPLLAERGCSLHTVANTKNYPCTWAKVYKDGTRFLGEAMMQAGCQQGIFVDVFPYYPLDRRPLHAKRQIELSALAQNLLYLHYIAKPDIRGRGLATKAKLLVSAVGNKVVPAVLSPTKIMGLLERVARTSKPGDKVFEPAYAKTGTYERAAFFPATRVEYAGHMLPIPRDYDSVLTEMYGDYMTPPPEGERGKSAAYVVDFGDGVNRVAGKRG